MSALRLLAVGVTVGLLGAAPRADDKPDYAKLIVGKWEVTKADPGTVPDGVFVEFTKDGKIVFTVPKDGPDAKLEGTYKVEGAAFVMTIKAGDDEKTQTITITRFTDKELATRDKEDRVVELKRAK